MDQEVFEHKPWQDSIPAQLEAQHVVPIAPAPPAMLSVAPTKRTQDNKEPLQAVKTFGTSRDAL